MRKRILTAGLTFALLLGAVGCGNASASNTETDNTEAAKVEEVTEEVTEASEEETEEATEEAEKEVNEKDIVAESNASATDSTYASTGCTDSPGSKAESLPNILLKERGKKHEVSKRVPWSQKDLGG